MAAILAAGLTAPQHAHADGISDWFCDPDQQGRRGFEDRALHEAAAEAYGALESADAAFCEVMAHLRNREYRAGVRSFERPPELRRDFPGAAQKFDFAQAVVALVKNTRSQSNTGEERGIGAGEVIIDNESELGDQTVVERTTTGDGVQSAEKRMRSVDTDVSDLLTTRLRIEREERA